MMKQTSDVVACVVDHGLFPHIAICCAEKFDHVFYTGPSIEVMERLKDAAIGDGFDNITRVRSWLDVKGQCDLYVFPDIGFAAEQRELVSQGFPVWGHHGADALEIRKGLFLDTLESLGMDVPPHVRIVGLDNLKDHLRDAEDKYVKISKYRGDWETFHFRNWAVDESALDYHSHRLGPLKNKLTFYVFDKIDTPIEDGIDTFCIDGNWPKRVLHAMERKDKSLIGGIQDMSEIHEDIRSVNELFGPVLGRYGYRGAFSTEVRPPYFIDPTCRFGSPPSQLQTSLITNLPEIIWAGANGEIVEIESDDPMGAQVLITSDRDKEESLVFQMPNELRPFVKSSFSCEVDGDLVVLPNPLENWAGWLVATGGTISEVIDTLKHLKGLLPDGFDCDLTSLCDLLKELKDAEKQGIEITDKAIPAPEEVVSD